MINQFIIIFTLVTLFSSAETIVHFPSRYSTKGFSYIHISTLYTYTKVKLTIHAVYIPIINPWHKCAARDTVVGLCVCVSVTTILLLCAMQHPKKGTNEFSSKS